MANWPRHGTAGNGQKDQTFSRLSGESCWSEFVPPGRKSSGRKKLSKVEELVAHDLTILYGAAARKFLLGGIQARNGEPILAQSG